MLGKINFVQQAKHVPPRDREVGPTLYGRLRAMDQVLQEVIQYTSTSGCWRLDIVVLTAAPSDLTSCREISMRPDAANQSAADVIERL